MVQLEILWRLPDDEGSRAKQLKRCDNCNNGKVISQTVNVYNNSLSRKFRRKLFFNIIIFLVNALNSTANINYIVWTGIFALQIKRPRIITYHAAYILIASRCYLLLMWSIVSVLLIIIRIVALINTIRWVNILTLLTETSNVAIWIV